MGTLIESTLYLNSPLSISTVAPSMAHPGLKNIPPHLSTPQPWTPQISAHFRPHYLPPAHMAPSSTTKHSVPFTPPQSYAASPHFSSTPLHYAYPVPTNPIPVMGLTPVHFYAGCYPPPFLYPTTPHPSASAELGTVSPSRHMSENPIYRT
jgi:hypothetical protein